MCYHRRKSRFVEPRGAMAKTTKQTTKQTTQLGRQVALPASPEEAQLERALDRITKQVLTGARRAAG